MKSVDGETRRATAIIAGHVTTHMFQELFFKTHILCSGNVHQVSPGTLHIHETNMPFHFWGRGEASSKKDFQLLKIVLVLSWQMKGHNGFFPLFKETQVA